MEKELLLTAGTKVSVLRVKSLEKRVLNPGKAFLALNSLI
jgi:hypothetical protein